MTGSDVSLVTGSNVSHVTGSDVIFPRFFITIVVVQNVPLLFIIRFTISDYSFGIFWSLCCLSFDLRLLIIRLVFSSFPVRGHLYYYYNKKKGRENCVTSGDVTDVTSGDDVTSGSTEHVEEMSNDMENMEEK